MSRMTLHCVVLTGILLFLAGCASRDPYYRTDVWRPTGANAANIAVMAADPHDLIRGRGDTRQLAKAPELAVEKVWAGSVPGAKGSSGGGGSAPAAPPGG